MAAFVGNPKVETDEWYDALVRFFDLDPLFQWRILEMCCCSRGALGHEHTEDCPLVIGGFYYISSLHTG